MNGETTAVKIHSSSQRAGGRGTVQIWKRGKEKGEGGKEYEYIEYIVLCRTLCAVH